LDRVPSSPVSRFRRAYPAPPRLHWLWIVVLVGGAEVAVLWGVHGHLRNFLINLVIAIWPVYLCLWLRKVEPRSTSLYWALASFATGFLFSWLLWIVVVFEIREDILDHFNRREPIGLRLNLLLTALFSFAYFQYHLRRIALAKDKASADLVPIGERSAQQ
jgi:hypothetical protein